MSASKTRSNSLAGLTLDAVLSGKIATPLQTQSRPLETQRARKTLLDIIREEQLEGENKDRTTWKTFREKLRLKRAGAAWSSSPYIPFADIVITESKHHRKNQRFSHRSLSDNDNSSIHLSDLISTVPMSDPPGSSGRAMFTRGSSMRVGSAKNAENYANATMPGDGPPSRSFRPQLSRHDSVRDHGEGQEENTRRQPVVKFVEERTMSARDAVAAQEASEAEAAAAAEDSDDEEETGENSAADGKPGTMSLMDLLEETDRQMGLTGSRYAMDDDDYDEEDGDEYDEDDENREEDEGEFNCCVCSVKIKGAAFIPCGHTFCKLCSKELLVQEGHCPVCSTFVIEFLEIF
ncbi:PREDICTED: uncharacterized protein LOC104818961 [Tarenaya hassleriana]|uniref:uncharacterized protein LOC104818961 n=1 Tax=Tarenaya hassleriana TaxID=28532 RepID=UPI00053C13B6|nr:PREDICTED: uncharacterized protein LOC104818961 [Tarenaya hassleriana]XP_010547085.1 PREDICTED: uncharacterized protein LOC104818961 [Tarenaya hassleriana]